MEENIEEATLVFREQSDGRMVSRLPGGKVVLISVDRLEEVSDGEKWLVRLRHKETFAIAQPVQRLVNVPVQSAPASGGTVLATTSASAIRAPAPPEVQPAHIGGVLIEPENIIRAGDRVAFFVDGANMDHAARDAGFFLDFRKVRDYFLGNGEFYAGFYYVADFSSQDPLQVRFLDFLSHVGFIVRKKPVKVLVDQETGERIYKGNVDTEIVLDMVNTVGNYDVAVLFSGDSDFERAVDLLRSRGKRVYVVSSKRTLSRELAFVADKPIFLIEGFRSVLERSDRARIEE